MKRVWPPPVPLLLDNNSEALWEALLARRAQDPVSYMTKRGREITYSRGTIIAAATKLARETGLAFRSIRFNLKAWVALGAIEPIGRTPQGDTAYLLG
jgi:hypothetical protein